MKILQVDSAQIASAARPPRAAITIAVVACALVSMAAGYGIAHVNASQWRSATEAALDLLANSSASDAERRDAVFVLHRNQELIRLALEREAKGAGSSARNAQAAIDQARTRWNR